MTAIVRAEEAPSDPAPQGAIDAHAEAPPPTATKTSPTAAREAPAAPTDDPANLVTARSLFWKGHHEYERGNYATAIALFEQSYRASPQPETLFNLALAMARDQHCADAARTFQGFSGLPMAEEERARAAATFDSVQATCVETPRKSTPEAVAPQSAPSPPEKREPAASQVPKPTERERDTSSAIRADPAAKAGASYWTDDRVLGWSLAAGAAVATGGAVYFNHRQQSALENAWTAKEENNDNAADEMAELHTERNVFLVAALASAATAGGLAIAATKLLVFSGSDAGTGQVAVAVSPGRLAISGEF